ncbi:MAG: MurR/RpiR family transcriptional regulator [Tabrizicola sp.]|jgi:DNA-binding MurR/RpiR family transcriptional regulator|nr:MurR/RpiR family transcriptional regulator [Tabrizicola sp.]
MQSPSPPSTIHAFHDRLLALRGTLPRRLQDCADYLLAHHDQIALSTVAQIAERAGVPPSAIMRFCQILGFSGFAAMQKLFRDALTSSPPDYATRLHNLKARGADHPAALLAEFVEAGRLSLEGLTKDLDEDVLDQCVDLLSRARIIHLAGFRRSFPVASYLSYAFDKLDVPCLLHDGVAGLGQRSAMQPGDALLAITFAPYSGETLDLARHAQHSGLAVVLLTDPPPTALLDLADAILTVREVDFGAFRSLSAAIALALALAVAVAARRDG